MAGRPRLEVERTILVLLAAGRSRRFGDEDKLAALVGGRALGLHVVRALAELAFLDRVAVVGDGAIDYAAHGCRVLANPDPDRGMASSLGIGVAFARDRGADAVLIALADMPRVTAAHVRRLFDDSDGPGTVVASSDDGAAMPPVLFGRDRFDALTALHGANGARGLLLGARHVMASAGELVDVDTVADLTGLGEAQGGEGG